ncbi:hypothetical protein MIZ03_4300 [Rhodoferax lithotrophicus]|uniref:Type II secretion system protein GspB C-terminal domain-containing protein n=1 Tax=Rhodoferax lithotrophicus TaxID=2798804 RepID=A0ABN6DBJ4_9BURK|nr:general secretion pathway protein GspB [Rhodoferax sp. MIZ03]BCO29377.1 hypothetical protein MIZ03_4300 [Rhodoferax sp. MIZ03]
MSYILDALQRAEAQRARGTVPGLHAQPLPGVNHTSTTVTSRQRVLWRGLAIAVLMGAGWGFWAWRTSTGEAAQATPPVSTVAAPVIPSAELPVRAPVVVLQVVPRDQPQAVAPPATKAVVQEPPLPRQDRVVSTSAAPQPVAPSKPETPAANHPPGTPVPQPPVASLALPAAQASPVPKLADLPESLRRQIPAVQITGSVYSDSPSQRLLLVNNQVLPQGSTVAAELILEEIRVRSAVFSFRGTRFQMGY